MATRVRLLFGLGSLEAWPGHGAGMPQVYHGNVSVTISGMEMSLVLQLQHQGHPGDAGKHIQGFRGEIHHPSATAACSSA